MKIIRAGEATKELTADVARLLAQLTARTPPSGDELADLIAAPSTSLFLAEEEGTMLGMLTLVLYRIPTGLRGRIEDVVVDEAARGKGVGEKLTRAALELAARAGAQSVALTSSPAREAANRLYQRIGFERRETNVYVWRPR